METKVKFFSSMRTKIVISLVFMVVLTGVLMKFVYDTNMSKMIASNNENYINDLAISYGKMLDLQIEDLDADSVLKASFLEKQLGQVGLEGITSSYVYVVSPKGTMLYHPTPEKIGQPVENVAVTSAVEKISKGEKVNNEVIEYEFKGAMKYAGMYVNDNQDYILVVTADKEEIFAPFTSAKTVGVLVVLGLMIAAIVVGLLVAYVIVRPINILSKLILKLADMDFTEDEIQKSLNKRQDETGRMSRALSTVRTSLSEVVSNIRQQSDEVKEAADMLSISSDDTKETMNHVEVAVNDIAEGASAQANDTQVATENIIVMGDMVEDTKKEVDILLNYANRMQDTTKQAEGILNQLADINGKAQTHIEEIAKQTTTTNESALKISEATKLITAIAEETTLLSLNASIEAARAGEQGKGFAVVASEIQKLAEQSNESALHIEEIISSLIQETQIAVETMEDVKEIIRTQSNQVDETEKVFQGMNEGVQFSVQGINHISEKTAELDKARIKVVDIVQGLAAIAEENAAGSEETSASVSEVTAIVDEISNQANGLNGIADELEKHMYMFKI